jgi:hypothetical protein
MMNSSKRLSAIVCGRKNVSEVEAGKVADEGRDKKEEGSDCSEPSLVLYSEVLELLQQH